MYTERIPIFKERHPIVQYNCNTPIGYVYLITNKLLDKSYVGIKFSNEFVDDYWGSCNKLSKDILKYGIKFFTRTVIEWCETTEELYNREIYWIHELNLYLGKGYNSSEGGGGGNTWAGQSDSRKKQISSLISLKARERAKSIVQISRDTLEIIRRFDCIKDVEKFGYNPSVVCNCVIHKESFKSYKGYAWMYEEEYYKCKNTGNFPDFSRKPTTGSNNPNYKHGKYTGEWLAKKLKRKEGKSR